MTLTEQLGVVCREIVVQSYDKMGSRQAFGIMMNVYHVNRDHYQYFQDIYVIL